MDYYTRKIKIEGILEIGVVADSKEEAVKLTTACISNGLYPTDITSTLIKEIEEVQQVSKEEYESANYPISEWGCKEILSNYQVDQEDRLHSPYPALLIPGDINSSNIHHNEHVYIEEKQGIQGDVIDYAVVKTIRVRSALKNGWELYGNPFMIGDWSCQAVIKRKKTEVQ